MNIAMTFTRLRIEERMLIEAFDSLGVQVTPVDLRQAVINPMDRGSWGLYDAVIDRSLSLTNTLTSVRMLEAFGIRCFNNSASIHTCSDKLLTSLAMIHEQIPTPQVRVALTAESGLEAIEELGYPAVIKPTVGSWGRLVARVNDRDSAEAILEHRETLGSVQQKVFYIQEHIAKPERDLRVFVVGGEAIAAIARSSEHWVTNTARGAVAQGIEVSDELRDLSLRAVSAVGADLAAVDFLECPERGLLVNEINHSMEFRNSVETTGVDIPQRIAAHVAQYVESTLSQTGVPA
ncbi:MAG: lysine biosynthesis protein LysX [Phycisphaerales bacterium]|nr:lysine biosynthesis protein LysX [Phycisphaerales bacterium]